MKYDSHLTPVSQPRLHLRPSDEEVTLYVEGFAVLRAVYEAEGYYDEAADGEPAEEVLYRIEVLDAQTADAARDALEVEGSVQLAKLGLSERTVHRLFPAVRWTPEGDDTRWVAQYLLALGYALYSAVQPLARQGVLDASVHWSPAVILDRFEALPRAWRRALGETEAQLLSEVSDEDP